ncbi:diphthine--ammonia ligase [Candidatus Methanarcanum hacksteinii]|uniref:diphthine--ammonia ligase n=1 Tax=Candidatus Methanarcanum hacksteinii TaxID=2911857 RepID=UPI0037DD981A
MNIILSMRLAALYSGGKDSTFATYLAHQMGHEISLLVNIVPMDKASWIFHTPNLSIVPKMAEAMDIPLISVVSDGTEEGDMDALKDALEGLDIDGVVVGALWSDYQWDRMNRVLGELDLIMLAPLWRKDQDMVYDEMVSAGIDAIIVGVFAEGLDEGWLGRHIDNASKDELKILRSRYGISIMGEGGEYESMTLDSPMFKKRLVINSSNKNVKKGVGTLDVTDVILEDKTSE